MNRVCDVIGAGLGLLLFAPLFLVTALAIRLDSPGPVFFRQTRVGLHGRPIRIHKFRSMRDSEPGLLVTTATDPRITRVGQFLRRTRIDELPQLFDVFRGDMSLVGPRPEVPQYVGLWPDDLRPVILSVRPGITDPASVHLLDEADILACTPDPERTYIEELLPLKAQVYAQYVQSKCFLGDIGVLLATLHALCLPAIVVGRSR